MVVDPAVSREKFKQEVNGARAHPSFHKQGIWILRAEFPIVFVTILTPIKIPLLPGTLAAVHIDYSDYDVSAPSILFVDPFTEKPLSYDEILWKFPRTKTIVYPSISQNINETINYVQSFDITKPFLCASGVREYHECSAHSGDSWFLHRGKKGNLLVHILTILQHYGSNAIDGVQIQISQNIVHRAVL